jgi:hypothetical protein
MNCGREQGEVADLSGLDAFINQPAGVVSFDDGRFLAGPKREVPHDRGNHIGQAHEPFHVTEFVDGQGYGQMSPFKRSRSFMTLIVSGTNNGGSANAVRSSGPPSTKRLRTRVDRTKPVT